MLFGIFKLSDDVEEEVDEAYKRGYEKGQSDAALYFLSKVLDKTNKDLGTILKRIKPKE